MRRRPNKWFFSFILVLAGAGFFIFSSAALGLHSRDGASFFLVVGKQLAILVGGFIGLLIFSKIPYRKLRVLALPLFVFSLLLTAAVFLPGLGFSFGGAKRWLDLKFLSFQPSELLKFGLVVYLAAWLSRKKVLIEGWRGVFFPFILIISLPAVVILKQPDLGTFLIAFSAAFVMLFVAGVSWRQVFLIIFLSLTVVSAMAYFKPYVRDRLLTLLDPSRDMQGSAYQINQSLIALGSGGWFGRGFGQSTQKFRFLPEPIGDSVFAVAGEEFGFLGTSLLVVLFLFFAVWGFKIAARAPDVFGRLLAVGIVTLVTAGAMVNIGSMVGLLPVVGVPLSFVSHGGSALLITLLEIGILLNISKHS